MTRNPSPQQTLQQLPKKWALAIVIALIAYTLVQPLANSRFGWSLPSVAGLLGMEKPTADKPAEEGSARKTSQTKSKDSKPASETESEYESQSGSDREGAAPDEPAVSETKQTSPEPKQVSPKSNSEKSSGGKTQPAGNSVSKPTETKQAKPEDSDDLLYGLLKDTGREVYVSPAGLRYTRGSEEGHRLKHLEKHLKDIPDRPGKHGVFDGDMPQVLRWIDDAYTRGKQSAKGVRKREEDGRTVYEVPFTKPIGYIGGRDGKRDNNPDAKRLRLVVDGDQVITAFPF